MDDFILRAMLAGIGLALVSGPLGCFVVWRRMAYFGDTMSHSALLGVALAFLLNINLMVGVLGVTVTVSLCLLILQKRGALSTDALLGLLSHSALALGMVLIAFMSSVRFDLLSLLFGDILAVGNEDVIAIYACAAVILGLMYFLWRPLLASTVNRELAEAEGFNPDLTQLVFMVMMAAIIAIAMKIVGVLLITALLIIPAATARWFARTPEQMAVASSIIGVASVILGLEGSLQFDSASGPSIVVASLCLFLLSLFASRLINRVLGKERGQ
ncbi:High-affinity zinc uptake system membrane protein ZnuB [Pseudovibrio sp. W64]|nr:MULTISPECIES: metal ABC transporter permease [unclassified Pseudovibrio]KZK79210.1 High-affinity zinc uptake system membrane protein ZnuB [Pseudovibrio sp. W64]KZK86227.1 High-affinity zinc uptake system membrane protein ZnuB [Pseudovibrio sp. Ad13]KZK91883.1 High-affinity zinc uptake system membrane protein ZnuB [Pseudovibrio sp. Ad46]KZK92326.1 High-affinity zinc uptake system membrane protein ZnuB [Pseudovibrio sp. W74]KZL01930.1 High-affinity zinc uptake system membrane protein ZnuB [Ps